MVCVVSGLSLNIKPKDLSMAESFQAVILNISGWMFIDKNISNIDPLQCV